MTCFWSHHEKKDLPILRTISTERGFTAFGQLPELEKSSSFLRCSLHWPQNEGLPHGVCHAPFLWRIHFSSLSHPLTLSLLLLSPPPSFRPALSCFPSFPFLSLPLPWPFLSYSVSPQPFRVSFPRYVVTHRPYLSRYLSWTDLLSWGKALMESLSSLSSRLLGRAKLLCLACSMSREPGVSSVIFKTSPDCLFMRQLSKNSTSHKGPCIEVSPSLRQCETESASVDNKLCWTE